MSLIDKTPNFVKLTQADIDAQKLYKKSFFTIECMYIISIILWLIFIFTLKMYQNKLMIIVILLIPIILFLYNFMHVDKYTSEIDVLVIGTSFLSFAFIVTAILTACYPKDKTKIYNILAVASIFIIFTLIDIWTPRKDILILKHFKSISEVFSLLLLGYIIVMIYYSMAEHQFHGECYTDKKHYHKEDEN